MQPTAGRLRPGAPQVPVRAPTAVSASTVLVQPGVMPGPGRGTVTVPALLPGGAFAQAATAGASAPAPTGPELALNAAAMVTPPPATSTCRLIVT